MVYHQASTDFTTPTGSDLARMASTSFTGTFPRMKDKKSTSQHALNLVKSASTWNLSEQEQQPLYFKRGDQNGAKEFFDTFGISNNTLNKLLPSVEDSWRDILSSLNRSSATSNEEDTCNMSARNVLNETLRNCTAGNTLIRKKLALALELQNAMYSIG